MKAANKKFLVLDDDTELLNLLALQSKKAGFEAKLSTTQDEALDLLESEKFFCVVLDIILGTNQISDQVIRFLQHKDLNEMNPKIPIVVMSAHMKPAYAISIKEKYNLIVTTLQKPFSSDHFVATIKKIFEGEIGDKVFNNDQRILEERVIVSGKEQVDNDVAKLVKGVQEEVTHEKIGGITQHLVTNEVWEVKKPLNSSEIELLENASKNIDGRNEMGDTLLMQFCRKDEYLVCQKLMDMGAQVNLKNKEGQTALHIASAYGGSDLVALLLKHHAKPNAKDEKNSEPLYSAVTAGMVENAKLLLQAGVRRGVKVGGETYLHVALNKNHFLMFKFLLDEGMDPAAKNDRGESCIDIVKRKKLKEYIPLLKSLKVKK